MVERNKYGPLSFPAVLWSVSVYERKILKEKKYIIRERVLVVAKIDMLIYSRLQWYGSVL